MTERTYLAYVWPSVPGPRTSALVLTGAGLLLGVVGALAVTRLTTSFPVGVTSGDPGSMGASVATVVGVTLAAAYVPAMRTARADPVVAMRTE